MEDNKPDTTKGRMTYKPESYTVLVQDAAAAIGRGLKDGMEVMEVEFPAIAGLDGAYRPPVLQEPQSTAAEVGCGSCVR